MNKVEKYISFMKGKVLSDNDITEICKKFKLSPPNFGYSHDWIYRIISNEILRKKVELEFKQYLDNFQDSNGIDYKKLERQINLSGKGECIVLDFKHNLSNITITGECTKNEIKNKKVKVRLCITKYSKYKNNYDNCTKEEVEGCEGCPWYVDEVILRMFEYFESYGFQVGKEEEERKEGI